MYSRSCSGARRNEKEKEKSIAKKKNKRDG